MNQKFHIKPDGTVGVCKAVKRKCRYGGQHFETFEGAQRYADKLNSMSRLERLELSQPLRKEQKELIMDIANSFLKFGSRNPDVEDFKLNNQYTSYKIEITKDYSNGIGFRVKIGSSASWGNAEYKVFTKDNYYFTKEIIGNEPVPLKNTSYSLSTPENKAIFEKITNIVKDKDPELREELGRSADISFNSLTFIHDGNRAVPDEDMKIYYSNGKSYFRTREEPKTVIRTFTNSIPEPYKSKPRQLKKVKINNPLLKDEKIYRLTELENLKYNNIEDSQFIIQDKKLKNLNI